MGHRILLGLVLLAPPGLLATLVGCRINSLSPKNAHAPEQRFKTPPATERARFTRNIDRSMFAQGVQTLDIRCGKGLLKVTGAPSSDRLTARAVVVCDAQKFAEAERLGNQTELNLDAEGTESPTLSVTEPRLMPTSQDFRADLTVVLPASVHVRIFDGEGDVEVRGLTAGLEIVNSTGTIQVSNIRGGVKIENEGVRTTIRDVGGLIRVKDGPGDLTISEASGEVKVKDTSGKLRISFVTGNVTAENNPEGIEIINIEGDVLLVDIPADRSTMQGVQNLRFSSSSTESSAQPR